MYYVRNFLAYSLKSKFNASFRKKDKEVTQLSEKIKLAIPTFLWLKQRYLSGKQCDVFFVSYLLRYVLVGQVIFVNQYTRTQQPSPSRQVNMANSS